MKVRAFVAARLPEALASDYSRVQRELDGLGAVKCVERHNLHLTLKFLGDVERERLAPLAAGLAAAAAATAPFSLRAVRVTAFPRPNAARVLVVELEDPSGGAMRLQRAVERELAGAGVAPEERAFRCHLTLGRVKKGSADARELLARVAPPAGEWPVGEIELLESRLGSSGPTYVVIQRFRLGE